MTVPGTAGPSFQYRPPTRASGPEHEPPRTSRPSRNVTGGSIAHQDRELRELLRRRLLISAGVVIGFFGLLPLSSLRFMGSPDVPATAQWILASQWVVAILSAAIAVLVHHRPTRTLHTLRILEMLMFGLVVIQLIVGNAYVIQRFGLMTPPIETIAHPVITLSGTTLDLVTIRWFVVIVGYGALIPNSLRRCIIATGLFAGIFLTAITSQALYNGVSARELASLLVYPVVWTIVGSVVAVFGSYRISILEKRVADAQRLGQYRITRHLGAGGMGEVFLAEHVLLKQPFAIKLLRPERVANAAVLQRFEREVHAMAQLEHWNTVEIYDFGHGADGSFYYVMEYLPGFDLNQLIKNCGPIPPARAIHILRQVCAALGEAHANGLFHRDIKPGNVIVCERAGIYDVAKLLDFGLVKSAHGEEETTLTQEGMVAGTPAYMSPEQATGMENADARSDIYSVGAVAYFLLTGRLLFVKSTAMQTLAAHLYEPAIPPSRFRPDLDPTLEAVIMRCVEKKPEERYPDIAALDRALSSCPGAGEWTQKEAASWWRTHG
jgi:tRNA A-37 threonylcarbamoyl transferase component Bud32